MEKGGRICFMAQIYSGLVLLIEQQVGLHSGADERLLDFPPTAYGTDGGVVKQQPLFELLREGIGLIVVPKVADNAPQMINSSLGGRIKDASSVQPRGQDVYSLFYCPSQGLHHTHIHQQLTFQSSGVSQTPLLCKKGLYKVRQIKMMRSHGRFTKRSHL